MAGTGGIF